MSQNSLRLSLRAWFGSLSRIPSESLSLKISVSLKAVIPDFMSSSSYDRISTTDEPKSISSSKRESTNIVGGELTCIIRCV